MRASARPIGVVAFALSVGVVVVALSVLQTQPFLVARNLVPKMLELSYDVKWQSLLLQRAALARSDVLVAFGSSELANDLSLQYRPPLYFANAPTGFYLFAVASGGIGRANFGHGATPEQIQAGLDQLNAFVPPVSGIDVRAGYCTEPLQS